MCIKNGAGLLAAMSGDVNIKKFLPEWMREK